MNGTIEQYLGRLAAEGNLRSIPRECDFDGTVDFSSNDYLGLSAMTGLQEEFLVKVLDEGRWAMGACASRLLATRQQAFDRLESTICGAYGGRAALLFGSGYHANTGIVAAIADKNTTIVADRLVHASIIDGIRLSGAKLARFRQDVYKRQSLDAVGEAGEEVITGDFFQTVDAYGHFLQRFPSRFVRHHKGNGARRLCHRG